MFELKHCYNLCIILKNKINCRRSLCLVKNDVANRKHSAIKMCIIIQKIVELNVTNAVH